MFLKVHFVFKIAHNYSAMSFLIMVYDNLAIQLAHKFASNVAKVSKAENHIFYDKINYLKIYCIYPIVSRP